MIVYQHSVDDVTEAKVEGLFAHWPQPPAASDILRIFYGSDHTILAIDDISGEVIGYVTAISDGVSAAYIPHLEVRSTWQGQGIGSELMRRILTTLDNIYMIDLMCDEDLQPFYTQFGFRPWSGMLIRNYHRQACD